jgi:aldose 1-epimerase
VNEWNLRMPSMKYLEVDPERLLPISIEDCSTRNFDFHNGRKIGNLVIDHAFQIDSEDRKQRIELTSSTRSGVWMEYDSSSKWIQIHTADRENGIGSRKSLAVEPMSCPPDAFNSRVDIIWLKPRDSHEMSWRIGALS